MTDYQKFAEYWNEAVNGLVYRIKTASTPVLTEKQVQDIWRDELLTRRFFSEGVYHGSKLFLDDLATRESEMAEQIKTQLQNSRLSLGMSGAAMTGKAGGALGALAAGAGSKKTSSKALLLSAAAALLYSAAKEASQGSKGALLKAVEDETTAQLCAYHRLFQAK